jgi:hypothetical protein
MSDKELARLEVLRDLDQRRLRPAAAARLLGLERRQVFRLLKVYRSEAPCCMDMLNPLKKLDTSESVNLHKCLILLDSCRIHATRCRNALNRVFS